MKGTEVHDTVEESAMKDPRVSTGNEYEILNSTELNFVYRCQTSGYQLRYISAKEIEGGTGYTFRLRPEQAMLHCHQIYLHHIGLC